MAKSMNINVGVRGLTDDMTMGDIKIPQALRETRKTGIPWFDNALGGQGFTPSTCMMLTGGPGCGKTTLTLQLADAIQESGHVALYNTGEESLYQVAKVSERLNLKKRFYPGQYTKVKDLLKRADDLRKKFPKKQVFILQDSLQTLDDEHYANGTTGATPLRCCELLTDWAKSTFGIVLFIGQVNKNGDFSGKNGIKHCIDVHGHLFFDEDKKSETWGERLFEISKNRFGCNGKTYIVGMNEKGLYEKGSFQLGKDIELTSEEA